MLPDYVDPTSIEALQAKYERRLRRERRAREEAEELLEAKSGELYVLNMKLQRLALELEQRVVARTRDLALAERKALSLAERDQLTGIANRMVFARMSEEAILAAKARRSCFALLLIDLDHFKHVNDGFGHDAGDKLLCEAADRIIRATRSPDCVARLGGDEFAVLVDDCSDVSDLSALASRIIEIVGEPIRYREQLIEPSCSIGIAIYPDHAGDAAELQRLADLALYKAKGNGRRNFAIFDDRLRQAYDERHALGSDLKSALAEGDVEPWFQPVVDAHSHKLVGVEALARWHHPTRGHLSPATFLAVAEERGLTNDFFVCMLRAACRKTLPWIAKGFIRRVALNVSPSQFRSGQLANTISRVLTEEKFPPSGLIVEITEELLLRDVAQANLQLDALAKIGIRIALDDFGVGYSNIGYLRRLPIHQLKLDRVLTADIDVDPKARTILGAIIDIARTFGLTVVAEGIETPSQARWLSHIGCDKLQGFHFGRPSDWDHFTETWASATIEAGRMS